MRFMLKQQNPFRHEKMVSESRLIEGRAWDFSGGLALELLAEF